MSAQRCPLSTTVRNYLYNSNLNDSRSGTRYSLVRYSITQKIRISYWLIQYSTKARFLYIVLRTVLVRFYSGTVELSIVDGLINIASYHISSAFVTLTSIAHISIHVTNAYLIDIYVYELSTQNICQIKLLLNAHIRLFVWEFAVRI
jgi:hypothetical protein